MHTIIEIHSTFAHTGTQPHAYRRRPHSFGGREPEHAHADRPLRKWEECLRIRCTRASVRTRRQHIHVALRACGGSVHRTTRIQKTPTGTIRHSYSVVCWSLWRSVRNERTFACRFSHFTSAKHLHRKNEILKFPKQNPNLTFGYQNANVKNQKKKKKTPQTTDLTLCLDFNAYVIKLRGNWSGNCWSSAAATENSTNVKTHFLCCSRASVWFLFFFFNLISHQWDLGDFHSHVSFETNSTKVQLFLFWRTNRAEYWSAFTIHRWKKNKKWITANALTSCVCVFPGDLVRNYRPRKMFSLK